jgi:uncharacterized protein (DUF486 family)
MTVAWYAHLKHLNASPWWIAALASWGVALFEYLLQVPANRIGFTLLTLPQLKIIQEVITLAVFRPVRCVLHEGADVLELPVGWLLSARCSVFHLQDLMTSGSDQTRYARASAKPG